MTQFIRSVLKWLWEIATTLGVSALAAGIMASAIAGPSNFTAVFLVCWAIAALLLFAFPEFWDFLKTPM